MRVKCIDLSYEGKGICKVDNKVIFVPNLLVGEEAIIEVTSSKKNFSTGRVIEYISQSEKRVKPVCIHYGTCGGCELQHMPYKDELEFKKNLVINNLKKYANQDIEIIEIHGDDLESYRNKVIVYFNQGKYGFYKEGSHDIVQIKECFVSDPKLIEICNIVAKYNINIERVMLRTNSFNKKMVILVSKDKEIKNLHKILEELKDINEIISIYQNVHPKMNSMQLGMELQHVRGEKYLVEEINGIKYRISPHSFFQINYDVTSKLYSAVKEHLSEFEINKLLDAYCGAGTIGLQVCSDIKEVVGIEVNEHAIEDANFNKELNMKSNIEFICGKTEDLIDNIKGLDAVVLDPPRSGCEQKVLKAINDKKVRNIIYVSCDSASLARDTKYLVEQGYEIKSFKLFNMFPKTHHVESLVVFSNKLYN